MHGQRSVEEGNSCHDSSVLLWSLQVIGSAHDYHFVHRALPHARTKRSVLHTRQLKADPSVSQPTLLIPVPSFYLVFYCWWYGLRPPVAVEACRDLLLFQLRYRCSALVLFTAIRYVLESMIHRRSPWKADRRKSHSSPMSLSKSFLNDPPK